MQRAFLVMLSVAMLASLGYRSPKAIGGVVAVVVGLLGGAVYLMRRRVRRT